jgi:hypothetical protein
MGKRTLQVGRFEVGDGSRAYPPPPLFLYVLILRDFKSNVFGCADSTGVIGRFLGSADSTGFSFDFGLGGGVCGWEVRDGVGNFSHRW